MASTRDAVAAAFFSGLPPPKVTPANFEPTWGTSIVERMYRAADSVRRLRGAFDSGSLGVDRHLLERPIMMKPYGGMRDEDFNRSDDHMIALSFALMSLSEAKRMKEDNEPKPTAEAPPEALPVDGAQADQARATCHQKPASIDDWSTEASCSEVRGPQGLQGVRAPGDHTLPRDTGDPKVDYRTVGPGIDDPVPRVEPIRKADSGGDADGPDEP